MIVDSKLFIKFLERCVIKLSSIVRHKHPRYSKSVHNILLDKVLNILLCNFRQGFSFHPLGEVIQFPPPKISFVWSQLGRDPKYPVPIAQKAMGPSLG